MKLARINRTSEHLFSLIFYNAHLDSQFDRQNAEKSESWRSPISSLKVLTGA